MDREQLYVCVSDRGACVLQVMGWGKANVLAPSPLDAHTAHLDFVELRAALCGLDVLSLSLNKERTKENQPKAAAFGNCSRATLQSVTREIKCTFVVLCLNVSYHAWQAGEARVFALK